MFTLKQLYISNYLGRDELSYTKDIKLFKMVAKVEKKNIIKIMFDIKSRLYQFQGFILIFVNAIVNRFRPHQLDYNDQPQRKEKSVSPLMGGMSVSLFSSESIFNLNSKKKTEVSFLTLSYLKYI